MNGSGVGIIVFVFFLALVLVGVAIVVLTVRKEREIRRIRRRAEQVVRQLEDTAVATISSYAGRYLPFELEELCWAARSHRIRLSQRIAFVSSDSKAGALITEANELIERIHQAANHELTEAGARQDLEKLNEQMAAARAEHTGSLLEASERRAEGLQEVEDEYQREVNLENRAFAEETAKVEERQRLLRQLCSQRNLTLEEAEADDHDGEQVCGETDSSPAHSGIESTDVAAAGPPCRWQAFPVEEPFRL